MTDSYRTADSICQSHFAFSILLFFHTCVSLADVTICLRRVLLLEYLTEYVLTSRRTRSYKICQNQSNPLWAGLAGPGRRRARLAVLTTQFRHFYSSRLPLATSHCPSTAMSKFFSLSIFSKIEFLRVREKEVSKANTINTLHIKFGNKQKA